MGKQYERVEIIFNKDSELEMQIYNHLRKSSEFLGKNKYIKQLILNDMKAQK